MANNQANIKAVITAEDKASASLAKFSGSVEGMSAKIASAAAMAGKAVALAAIAAGAFGVKIAGDLEAAQQGFATLLGSATKAQAIMNRIKDEAKRTPFEIPGLTKATQLLTAVTKDGDRALDFILNIGEGLAAMGRGQEELDRVAVNLQQIAATGRAFGIDIRQFAFAGIPIYEMLQEEIGLTGEALQTFIEDGGVTFELLEKMFKNASAEGGRWSGAFKNQAGTFNQSLANMKDSFSIFVSDFVKGTGIFEGVKDSLKAITEVFQGNNKAVVDLVNRLNEVFMPSLTALINTFETRLLPSLMQLWNAIHPGLTTAVGVILVANLWVMINTLNVAWSVISFGIRVISTLIGWLGNIAGAAWNAGRAMVDAFRSAFNTIARLWNGTLGRIKFEVPKWVPGIGGNKFDVADIPQMAEGGIVKARSGGTLAMLGEGGRDEAVIPLNKANSLSGVTINLQVGALMGTDVEARKFAQTIMKHYQTAVNSKGMARA